MSYVKRELVTIEKLTCSHPKVDRIWEYGALAGIPTNSEMVRCISIILKPFTPGNIQRHEFKDNGDGQAITDLEAFLETL